ncbi:CDP-glycerol glycerophosphotransferase family protein [Brachybacterium tyrofermentans]|uniref:CDP-glycerol glycerophosphotransferase family protein n=1 Tax=Brachybacterium tyrofermentans TaxID=47848 RepID=UPI003FCFD7EA
MKRVSTKKILGLIGVWPALLSTCVVFAVTIVAISGGGVIGTVALLVALLLIVYRQRRALKRRPKGVGLVSRYQSARLLLLFGAGLNYFLAADTNPALAALLLPGAVLIVLEGPLRKTVSLAVPYAANFPNRVTSNRARFRYGWLYVVSLGGIAALALGPVAGWLFPSIAAALLVLQIVLFLCAGLDVVRRVKQRHHFQREVPQALEEVAPVFYLYWHAPAGSTFQVKMWLPYLERIGVPYAVVVRTIANFREVSRLTDRPVILRRSISDLDDILVPSVRGVFYVNNAIRNMHMVFHRSLTHIQLLHGESDKAPSTNPVIRMYDFDFVAGQAAIDRFDKFGISMPEEMFRIVGRPQVEDVEVAEIGEDGVRTLESPTVLYAPTWMGYQAEANYSSLDAGVQIVEALLRRGCTVIFRPHPYTNRSREHAEARRAICEILRLDALATGREHLYGRLAERTMSVTDCYNGSDAMIADVSSVVGDYLHSEKPFAMTSPRHEADAFIESFPMARAAYVLIVGDGEARNLDVLLDDMLGDDSHRETRRHYAEYYLGDIPRENYADRFLEVAREELGLDPHLVVEEYVPDLIAEGYDPELEDADLESEE